MRRIRKARINFLSLCPRGANKLPAIYKEDRREGHANVTFEPVVKAADNFDEQGELHAVVYAPELVDVDGDVADQQVIKEMAYDAAKRGLEIDMRHDQKPLTKDQVHIAESFIIQKGDPRFADFKDSDGNAVDVSGGWGVVLKIDDPELRTLYRKGDWQGISMGGTAQAEPVEKAQDPRKLLRRLASALGLNPERTFAHQSVHIDGEIDMTPEELKKTLDERDKNLRETIVADVTKAIKGEGGQTPSTQPAAKSDDPAAGEKPVFKGDPLKIEDVRKHQEALRRYELRKSVDWSDPKSVEEYEKKLSELEKESGKSGDKGNESDKDESPEVTNLRKQKDELVRQIEQHERSSNQPASGDENSTLNKETQDDLNRAKTMVDYVNKSRGFSA